MQYILTDIEGTTTPVSFVYDTLFPYFITNLDAFAKEFAGDAGFTHNIELVQQTVWEEQHVMIGTEEALGELLNWTRTDRKHPALKNIQGMVWRIGYDQGKLQSTVYEDVVTAFTSWQESGIGIGIYSSGSVAAQQLLFRHAGQGDLAHFISDYFDTGSGNKREMQSYRHIAGQLQLPESGILFLSDTEAELDAAAAAGFQTRQIIRDNASASLRHPHAFDFLFPV